MTASSLHGRKILLIVGGGIAAYKALELIRLLRKSGAEVMTILTRAGAEFVTPMSLAALSGHPVRQELFMPEDETAMGHIELSRWADLVVVAPATAGTLPRGVATEAPWHEVRGLLAQMDKADADAKATDQPHLRR